MHNGILVINKPQNMTSRDVVNIICKKYNTKKVGHCGTLDPLASGVLIVCVGKALKYVQFLMEDHKKYRVELLLGQTTATLDREGDIVEEAAVMQSDEEIIAGVKSFLGSYEQEVPIYSAVKIKGKKLYEYAREGIEVELPKREVVIKEISNISVQKEACVKVHFDVSVSKGTFIRALCRDIASKLGTVGYMYNLIRIEQGEYKIEDSTTIEESNFTALKLSFKNIIADEVILESVRHGRKLVDNCNEGLVSISYDGEIIAVYECKQGLCRAKRVFI